MSKKISARKKERRTADKKYKKDKEVYILKPTKLEKVLE